MTPPSVSVLSVGTLSTTIFFLLCCTFLCLMPFHFGQAQNSTDVQNLTAQAHNSATISKEAQEELNKIILDPQIFTSPDPGDIEGWKKQYIDSESVFIGLSKPIIDLYQPNISETELGGVQVIDVKPRNWMDNGKVLVYTHGGAYTFGSANSTLASPVLVANATGLRIISVNYTVAPFSKWDQTTDEVLSVIQTLKNEQGYSNDDIAMFGDSAGGGLAAGSVLKMRDTGLGLPAALVLWSPWLDLTGSGDTYFTLRNADPYLSYDTFLKNAADAYADPADQKNPYVSPVYANFSGGYIPTLIQGGTKEIFLSDFVRLYQALDQTGIPVKLDIYEGMPHVHQYLYNTPESEVALSKLNDFLRANLDY
ncbi:MAG: alpha/beta hydrolase [Nitrososphaeraceae archaeon]